MGDSVLATTKELLTGALDESDESEVHFKVRSALQLLAVLEDEQDRVRQSLEEVDLDAETREYLRELGYLD